MSHVIQGAMTALVTPMRDGRVDHDALAALVDDQIAAGIDGLVAVGTTGESATLRPEEHAAVVARVVDAAAGRVPVLAGAGAHATATAIELSGACHAAGANGLLHVTPHYNKPTQGGLFDHFAAIAAACPLPIVLYNVPSRTGCDLLPDTVARLADLDRIVAIKEATGSMARASELLARCGDRIQVLSGDDATALPLYALGGAGVISVVSNVMPARVAAMWDAVRAGDWRRARALHFELLPLTRLLFAEPNPIPVKTALAIMGRCTDELRLPLTACSHALRTQLHDLLAREGLA